MVASSRISRVCRREIILTVCLEFNSQENCRRPHRRTNGFIPVLVIWDSESVIVGGVVNMTLCGITEIAPMRRLGSILPVYGTKIDANLLKHCGITFAKFTIRDY